MTSNGDYVNLKIRDLLNRRLRVSVQDGRIIIGTFVCVDPDCNMILSQCNEYTPDALEDSDVPRRLQLAMIPGKYATRIEVGKQPERPNPKCGRCSPNESTESTKQPTPTEGSESNQNEDRAAT